MRPHADGHRTSVERVRATDRLSGVCVHNVGTIMYSHCIYGNMRSTRTRDTRARREIINLRASHKQKALIDRAAETLGRSRSEFMLETACREAETVLLDRRYFVVPEEVFKEFTAILDRPPKDNPRLRRLLQTKPPWEK